MKKGKQVKKPTQLQRRIDEAFGKMLYNYVSLLLCCITRQAFSCTVLLNLHALASCDSCCTQPAAAM